MSPRPSVFLVSGNRLLREALTRILGKRSDIQVAGAAAYSPQVLQQIAESGCEILLLDSISMSSLQFIREVIRSVANIRVILIGMEDDEAAFLRAVQAGVTGYVLKDASAMDVVAAVRAVAQDEAVCPVCPLRLCRALFRHVHQESTALPNVRVKVHLGLTRRQQQLIPLIAQGLTNKEIASQLHLSEQTVKNHIHRMIRRVGVDDRLAVVEMVRVLGFPL